MKFLIFNENYNILKMVRINENNNYLIYVLSIVLLFANCEKNTNTDGNTNSFLPSDKITSIYIDSDNTKWFGTTTGLVSLHGDKWTTFTKTDGIAGDYINSIAFQKSIHGNEIWLATNTGVSTHTYDVDGITSATIYHKNNSILAVDTINVVAVDFENTRWFGTSIGIVAFSGHQWFNKKCIELNQKNILSIGVSTNGYNYFGTAGKGVARYKLDSIDGITGASFIESEWSALPNDTVLSISLNSFGDQWFGTQNGAALHKGTDSRKGWTVFSKKDGLISNTVLSVYEDSKGVCWFGTPDGLSSKNGNVWMDYTIDNGLPDNRINAIAEDMEGNLWFATDNGISVFNGVNWENYK